MMADCHKIRKHCTQYHYVTTSVFFKILRSHHYLRQGVNILGNKVVWFLVWPPPPSPLPSDVPRFLSPSSDPCFFSHPVKSDLHNVKFTCKPDFSIHFLMIKSLIVNSIDISNHKLLMTYLLRIGSWNMPTLYMPNKMLTFLRLW